MAGSPSFKIYTAENEYIASVATPFYGAMILAGLGNKGTTIRYGHAKKQIIYTDMIDGDASNSYDDVSEICYKRVREIQAEWKKRQTPWIHGGTVQVVLDKEQSK